MYNLNYTYLSDLDIDTSRSARDISASAVFVAIDDSDYYTPVSCVANRFVDWFFAATNPNIKNLDVTFKHAYLSGDALTPARNASLVTLDALNAKISATLATLSAAMLAKLSATKTALNTASVIPVGTVVINRSAPSVGNWSTGITGRCICEATTATGTGKIPSSTTVADVKIAGTTSIPKHSHAVTMTPATFNKSHVISDLQTGHCKFSWQGPIYSNVKPGIGTPAESDTIAFAWDRWDGADVEEDGGYKIEAIAERYKTMVSTSSTGGGGTTPDINIAPPVYKLTDAAIFVKTE